MIIESVDLKNYRNYALEQIVFDSHTNIIYGENAQGKTNILEALYVCATARSHKGSKDKDMIQFGSEEAHIKVMVKKHDLPYRIDMHMKKNKSKGIAVNGIPIKKATELYGILNIIFFSPEDLNLIKNGPAERRRFMDMELSQLDSIYLSNLINYNKVVNQRNKLLKELYTYSTKEQLDTLDIWDIQLVRYGKKVIEGRKKFLQDIEPICKHIHEMLSGGREQLELCYHPNVAIDDFSDMVARSREKDIRFKVSSAGPHKDDINILINGKDVRTFGSQGQQRTAALSLKLAEIELVKQVIKDSPVLLLDDVLSELDSRRQQFLLDSIGDIQTIVTCTGLDEFIKKRFSMNKIFHVSNGTVINEN